MSTSNLNIRQRLNRSRLNPDTRMLIEEGLVEIGSLTGAAVLTDLGRKVILDIQFESKTAMSGEALMKELVKQVKAVRKDEKDSKKS